MENNTVFVLVKGYDYEYHEFIGVFTDENDVIPAAIANYFELWDDNVFPDEDEDFYRSINTLEEFKTKIIEKYGSEYKFWDEYLCESYYYEETQLHTKN